MHFSIIVAHDERRGIGKAGTIPWRLGADMKHFARVTKAVQDPAKQNAVIMGRKTWESLPEKFRPLPGRKNIVLTRNDAYAVPEDVVVVTSLEDALARAESMDDVESVFVIGGGQIYVEALARAECKKAYITEVGGSYDCDTLFPEYRDYFPTVTELGAGEENSIHYIFILYER